MPIKKNKAAKATPIKHKKTKPPVKKKVSSVKSAKTKAVKKIKKIIKKSPAKKAPPKKPAKKIIAKKIVKKAASPKQKIVLKKVVKKPVKKSSSVKPVKQIVKAAKKPIKPIKLVKPIMLPIKKAVTLKPQPRSNTVISAAPPIQTTHTAKAMSTTTLTPLKSATVHPAVKKPSPITPRIKGKHTGGPEGFLPYEVKASEEYMNEKQLAHFQHVLNLWKEQLQAERNATARHMRDDTVNFPDPLDRAALEEEHTLEWRAREREYRLVAKIDQALMRIKQGDYGYCDGCGAEIGIRRLEARPTATQCIDCKTINEIRERHTGSSVE